MNQLKGVFQTICGKEEKVTFKMRRYSGGQVFFSEEERDEEVEDIIGGQQQQEGKLLL